MATIHLLFITRPSVLNLGSPVVVTRPVAGTLDVNPSMSGELAVGKLLAGTVNADPELFGRIPTPQLLEGSVDADPSLYGALDAEPVELAGTVNADPVFYGNVILPPYVPAGIESTGYGTRTISSGTTSINTTAPATVNANDKLLAAIQHRYALTVVPSGWTLVDSHLAAGSQDVRLSIYEKDADGSEDAAVYNWQQGTSGIFNGQVVGFRRDDGGLIAIESITKYQEVSNNVEPKKIFMADIEATYDDQMVMAWVASLNYDNLFVDEYVSIPAGLTAYPPITTTFDNRLVGGFGKFDAEETATGAFQQAFGASSQTYASISLTLRSNIRHELGGAVDANPALVADLSAEGPMLMDGEVIEFDGEEVEF